MVGRGQHIKIWASSERHRASDRHGWPLNASHLQLVGGSVKGWIRGQVRSTKRLTYPPHSAPPHPPPTSPTPYFTHHHPTSPVVEPQGSRWQVAMSRREQGSPLMPLTPTQPNNTTSTRVQLASFHPHSSTPTSPVVEPQGSRWQEAMSRRVQGSPLMPLTPVQPRS